MEENQKVLDLFSEDKSVEPFGEVMVGWTLDSKQLQASGFSEGQYTVQYTVKIERRGIERKIRVGYHYPPVPVYPKAVPPPRP